MNTSHEMQAAMAQAKEAVRLYQYRTLCESIGADATVKHFPAVTRVTNRSELDRKAKLELKSRGNWIGVASAQA